MAMGLVARGEFFCLLGLVSHAVSFPLRLVDKSLKSSFYQ
jgi:hypothetical protein